MFQSIEIHLVNLKVKLLFIELLSFSFIFDRLNRLLFIKKIKPISMRKNLLLKMVPLLMLLSSMAWAQERSISGKVTAAEDGSTLPGVNVIVKGTTTGTVTDSEGRYSLSVPSSGGSLDFSFVGFVSQKVEIGSKTFIDVQLATDVTQLSEVIVTGYGQQEKRTLSGSVSVVKGDVFENLPIQSIDRALQGRAAGVQISAASGAPGSALTVRVRGIGSINASNDPLWIIDGVQMSRFGQTGQGSSNPLAAINPNDVESIEILKDAASSAIYGAQAANGVIIVTTKKGKKGRTKLDVTVQHGVAQPLNLYNVMNAQQFAQIKRDAYTNAGLPLTGPTGANTIFGDPTDATLQAAGSDWVDQMFRSGNLSTYDISMSGGDEKTSFLLSGSYNKQEGQIIKNQFERGTLRLNVTHKPIAKLTLGVNLSLAYQRNFGSIANGNFVNGPFQAAFTAQPTAPVLDPAGAGFARYPFRSPNSHLFGYNIKQGVEEEVRLGRVPQTVSSFNASYEIIPGLTANGFFGIDASFGTDNNQRPGSIPVFPGGQMAVTSRRTIALNTNATVNYTKKFAQIHAVSFLGGFEYRKEERGGVVASQFTFANPALRLLSQGATARPAQEFFFDNAREGYFGQLKYVLKDRYIADFTLRRDGSSRFGSQTKYGNFFAGSVAWRLSEENFIKKLNIFQDLKMRASYGKVGNSEIADYDWFTAYGTPGAGAPGIAAGAQYQGGSILRLTRLGNDQISWEEKFQTSVGIDFSLFNGRLSGSAEAYDYQTKALLFDVPQLNDAGINIVRGNNGEVSNRGLDFELGGVVLDTRGFKWEARANLSFLRNELTALPNNQKRIGNDLIVGEPIEFNYLFDFAGINPANGKAMIYDTLGNLAYQGRQRDLMVKGSPIPTWFGGLSNTFSYKGLSLEIFFQYSGGNQAVNGDLFNLYSSGSFQNNQLTSQLDAWKQPGDITNVARSFQGGVIDGFDQQFGALGGTTQFLSDASFVRLKQVTLSYSLPTKLISKAKLTKCNIFFQGLNLWTYTKFAGIDPEVIANNAGTNTSTFGAYPVGRQFSAGITIGL